MQPTQSPNGFVKEYDASRAESLFFKRERNLRGKVAHKAKWLHFLPGRFSGADQAIAGEEGRPLPRPRDELVLVAGGQTALGAVVLEQFVVVFTAAA